MATRVVAVLLALSIPANVSAGPLKDAIDNAGRELAAAQRESETRSRGRFWTGIALVSGGAVLTTLGAIEVSDSESGPDDDQDADESNGTESESWEKAMLAGGLAAAAVGGVLLFTGRKSAPTVSPRRGGLVIRHTVRF